jgi:TP901 family phage tail tape measure protein
MARRTSVIQVMITGDSKDLQKATRSGASAFDFLGAAAIAAAKVIASAVSGIAAFSVREFAKFDSAMVQSQAIMGDLSETMRKEMSDAAREVAKTTTFSASEAAEAFYFLASAGMTAEQSVAALPAMASFAQAGMFDLARATDILTDAVTALGMGSTDAGENLDALTHISDVLVRQAQISNASVEQFGDAVLRAAPLARDTGISIEAMSAALGVLADRNIKGAVAGEQFAILLRDLPRAAANNADAFKAFGISIENADGSLRSLPDIVEDFDRALDGLSVTQRAAAFDTLGLTRSSAVIMRQFLGTADSLREYEAAAEDAFGATIEVQEKQLQSFSNQIALTRSAFADIGITIGEQLAGPLGLFNKWLRDQAPAIEAFVQSAIPQVTAFVERSVAKFEEFKAFYDENLAGPLGDLLSKLREIGGITLERMFEFKDAAATFLLNFANAVAEGESEEAGRVLGEAITNLLDMAFTTAGDLSGAIGEWFGNQDWVAIGASVTKHAGAFAQGLFFGLFVVIDEEGEKATKYDWSAFMRLLAAGLILRIPVFRNALSAKSGLFGVPIIGSVLRGLARASLLLTPGLGRLASFIGTTLATRIGTAVAGTRFAAIFSNVGLTLQRLFAGEFASLPARLGASIRGLFSGIGGFLLRELSLLGSTIMFGLNTAILRVMIWLQTGGLGLLLRGTARLLAGIVAAFFGWPVVLFVAATVAFLEFIRRFGRWNDDKGDEYEGFGEKIVAFIGDGVKGMAQWFKDTIIQWFKDRWESFSNWIDEQTGDFENIGSAIVNGIIQGIKASGSNLFTSLRDLARLALSAARGELNIKSPSREFARVGDEIVMGLKLGVDRSGFEATGAVSDLARQVAGVNFSAPIVPVGPRQGGGDIYITVNGALDAEGVARQIERVLRDSQRRTGGVLV